MSLTPGTRLGPYEITAAIGAGGMGEVYRARDTRLDREVAIKVLPAGSVGNEQAEARFDREARAIAGLSHPNICALFDVGRLRISDASASAAASADRSASQGSVVSFLVMELLEGETLHRRLTKGPLEIGALVDHAINLADALDTAHARGMLHRDLKPANLFLTSRGPIKILDFGLTKALGSSDETTRAADGVLTGEGTAVGTIGYMSPEQLRGEALDARSDLFALGIVMYEMATGQRPFKGSTGAVVSHAILGEHPISPCTIRPDLPVKLEETILKALEKNRDDRCQTAAELRADLRRVRRELPANVPRPAPTASVTSEAPAPSASMAGTALPAPAVSTTAAGSSDAQLVVGLVRRHRLAVLAIVGMVGAIVAGAWFASRGTPAGTPTAASTALQIQPLTVTGKTALGALSPDGKFVAYVHRDDDVPNYSLWVRQLATGSDMPIVPVVAGRSYIGVAVTPDGTYVDFVAVQRGAYSGDLWRVPFLGGTPRQIAHGVWSATGWAPDGRHMAFVREDSSTATSIIIADADGANERVLTTRHIPQSFYSVYWAERPIARPSWSSDGRSILATGLVRLPVGAARRNELVVIDVATGSEIRTVPLEKISLLDAAWLDESHALVNGTMPGKLPSLARVDLATGLMTPVTQDLAEFRGVSLTPDHQSAVTTRLDTRTAIWVGDASGAGMSEVVPDGPSRPGVVGLDSAGGVVYQAATTNGYGIYAIRPGEHTPTLVADNGTRPAVTSDGRRIVFQRDNDKIGLCRVNADGSGLTQLVDGDATSAVIMRDQTVLFLSNRSGDQTIWSVPIAGGSPREILHRFIARNSLKVSSDGSRLHFAAGFAGGREGTVPTMCDLPDCTNPRPANLAGRTARWTPDNQNVAYADQANVWVRPIAGGAPHPLTTFTDKTISDFTFSPDGKRLAVTRGTTLADIVLIKGIR